MYKYSITQWIFGNENIEDSFKRLKKYGYDGIEFAAEPYLLDSTLLLDLMKKYDIECSSLCGIFSDERDLTADPGSEQARIAIKYVKDSIDLASKVSAPHMIIVPSPVGRTIKPQDKSYDELWENAIKNISLVADYASSRDIKLCIEAVNRYETFFANTLSKAYNLVKDIGHDAVGIMADVFHMSLEENNIRKSLRLISDKLIHVHIADNTREAAGMGTTDFKEICYLLSEINYEGYLTMEFMPRLANPYDSGALETQSNLMDHYAEQAINYMKILENSLV